jgi:hypothetical protein
MRRLLSAAGLVAVLLSATTAGAQSAATPIPLPPKPDLSSLQGFIGTWSCSDKSSRRPAPSLSTVTYSLDPSGYWILGKTKGEPTAWYPHASASTDYYTYDSDSKHWVDVYLDTTGGYSVSTSPGPAGKTWVWHDSHVSAPPPEVASFTDSTLVWGDKDNYSYSYGFTTKAGKVVTVKGACKRTA